MWGGRGSRVLKIPTGWRREEMRGNSKLENASVEFYWGPTWEAEPLRRRSQVKPGGQIST